MEGISMARLALIVALLALTACGKQTPEQRARMFALGQSMSYQGAAWAAASRPVYTAPVYPSNAVTYCGFDGLGRPHFCY